MPRALLIAACLGAAVVVVLGAPGPAAVGAALASPTQPSSVPTPAFDEGAVPLDLVEIARAVRD